MTAPTRSPYETLRAEADAIGQHCRAAAEFAAPINRIAAHQLRRMAESADEIVRITDRLMLALDAVAGGEGHGI